MKMLRWALAVVTIACIAAAAALVLKGVAYAFANPELTRTQLLLDQGGEYLLTVGLLLCALVIGRFYERTGGKR